MPPVGWFLDKIIKLSKKWFRKLRIFRLMSYNITAQTSKSQDTVFFSHFYEISSCKMSCHQL